MHGILQPLHERFEMLDASLERAEAILPEIGGSRLRWLVRSRGCPADLANPRDDSLTLAHHSPRASPLGCNRARWVLPALGVDHLANHQRTARDLLTHDSELRRALVLGSRRVVFRIRVIWVGIVSSVAGAVTRDRGEIRSVGEENLRAMTPPALSP